LEESDADGEGEAEDSMGIAQEVWSDIKVRKYGSGDGGRIGRVRFHTHAGRDSEAEGGGALVLKTRR